MAQINVVTNTMPMVWWDEWTSYGFTVFLTTTIQQMSNSPPAESEIPWIF